MQPANGYLIAASCGRHTMAKANFRSSRKVTRDVLPAAATLCGALAVCVAGCAADVAPDDALNVDKTNCSKSLQLAQASSVRHSTHNELIQGLCPTLNTHLKALASSRISTCMKLDNLSPANVTTIQNKATVASAVSLVPGGEESIVVVRGVQAGLRCSVPAKDPISRKRITIRPPTSGNVPPGEIDMAMDVRIDSYQCKRKATYVVVEERIVIGRDRELQPTPCNRSDERSRIVLIEP